MKSYMNELSKFNKLDIAMSKGERISKEEFDNVILKLQAVSDYAADPRGLPPIPGLGYISKIMKRRLDIQLNKAKKELANKEKFKIAGGMIWRVDEVQSDVEHV